MYQGIPTKGKGSVQLTSSLRQFVLYKKENNILNLKRSRFKPVSARRSTVVSLPL
jgi:hypothetical protein